ncbi:hypothetical protein [Pseudomonas phage 98PfluR60PP]|uniref:Uncharacterized protein n=1 Tax=Pseudomonas phage 98PfluR60PP TaxID=2163965 RepID=A0A2S1PFX7_9CAUD|nr:hypothetical protein PP760_gp40 [Pseudomonas phage 98PfluR60PP]AWH15472.1 hypothetical protein [Pseudomonas phage 98PfluR60PP]
MGLDEKKVPVTALNKAKQDNNISNSSVLLSVSYLGYMTDKAMNGLPDIDPPTVASEKFREGMVAAIKYQDSTTNPIINPYSVNPDNDPQQAHDAEEWSAGYALVRTSQHDPKYDTAKPHIPVISKEAIAESQKDLQSPPISGKQKQ